MNLRTIVHLRDDGIRPYIELEPSDHPLGVDQQNGVTVDRIAEIIHKTESLSKDTQLPAGPRDVLER